MRTQEWEPGNENPGMRTWEWVWEWEPGNESLRMRTWEWEPGNENLGMRPWEWEPGNENLGMRTWEWDPGNEVSSVYDCVYTAAEYIALLGTLPLGLMALPTLLRSILKLLLTIFDIFFLTEMPFSVPKETDREKWKCSSGLEGESSCCTLRLWVSLGGENGTLTGLRTY